MRGVNGSISCDDMENEKEIEQINDMLASDEKIIKWMRMSWETKERQRAYYALPRRFRQMVGRGVNLAQFIKPMPPTTLEQIERVRASLKKRLDDITQLQKNV